jgi:hypothetical protein
VKTDTHPATVFFERTKAYRRLLEIGFWVVTGLVSAIGNSLTAQMDIRRAHLKFDLREPVIWEFSSCILWLALVPTVVWLTRRYPLRLTGWRRTLGIYFLASIIWSIVHVVGMVLIRKAVYAAYGGEYTFGNWLTEGVYEYLKDVRTFAGQIIVIEAYRLLLRRSQGEAQLLDVPEDTPPSVEPSQFPDRFLVRKLGREFLVPASDIEWIQAASNYANLHVSGRDYPLRSTLTLVAKQLDPARFRRVHRSYIVNVGRIVSIEPLDGGDAKLHLKDGATVPCSRRYIAELRSAIQG